VQEFPLSRLAAMVARRPAAPVGLALLFGLTGLIAGLYDTPRFESTAVMRIDSPLEITGVAGPLRGTQAVAARALAFRVDSTAYLEELARAEPQLCVAVDDLQQTTLLDRLFAGRRNAKTAGLEARLGMDSTPTRAEAFPVRLGDDGEVEVTGNRADDLAKVGLQLAAPGKDSGGRFQVRVFPPRVFAKDAARQLVISIADPDTGILELRYTDSDAERAQAVLASILEHAVADAANGPGTARVLAALHAAEQAARQAHADAVARLSAFLSEDDAMYLSQPEAATEVHPLVAELAALDGEIARRRAAGDGSADALVRERGGLAARLTDLIRLLPEHERLRAEVTSARLVLEAMRVRVAEFQLATDARAVSVDVLEPPSLPEYGLAIPAAAGALVGLLGGAFLGIALFAIRRSASAAS